MTSYLTGPATGSETRAPISRGRAALGLGLLVVMISVTAVGVVAAVVASGTENLVLNVTPRATVPVVFGVVAVPVVMLPAALVAARVGLRVRFRAVFSTAGRFRFGLYGAACIPALVVGIGATMTAVMISGGTVTAPTFGRSVVLALIVLLVFVPLQTLAEELVFRGVLVQLLTVLLRSRRVGVVPVGIVMGALVSATVFSAIHGIASGWIFAGHLVVGLLWTWLAERAGGVEPGAAAHAVWNGLLIMTLVTGMELPTIAGAGAFVQLLITDVLTVVAILAVTKLYRARLPCTLQSGVSRPAGY